MARLPILPTALTGTPDDTEAQFYEALQQGDIERLMALWADDDEIFCVHPGGPRMVGAAAIRTSFAAIFANGGIPVQPEQVHRLQHPGCALHHLVERIAVQSEGGTQAAFVLATNVYLETPLGWRLAAHHASPGTAQALARAGADAPSTLH